jgi:hypothetical protein
MGRLASRFNLVAFLATLLVCLGLVAAGDRTSWSQGYGFDGRTYGDLAQHFPGAVFGDEGVTPRGYGAFHGRRPQGIDAYYVRRIVPSAVVYLTCSALTIDKTPHNVVVCFEIWTALIVAMVALLWCLMADRLGLGRDPKLLGLFALLLNFAVLKAAFYWPVVTDNFAFGFAAASLYFWLTRNLPGLVAMTLLGSFTWPTELVLGAVLIVFPPGELPLHGAPLSLAGPQRRSTLLRAAVAAIPAAAAFGFLTHLRATGFQPPEGVPLGGAFWLSAIVASVIVFAGLLWLVPVLERGRLRELAGSLLHYRTLVAAGVVAAVLVGQALLATRASAVDQGAVFRSSLWYSASDPAIFLVTAIGYLGPLLVLAALRWRDVCRAAHSLGPGATLAMALFVVSLLGAEPRKLIVFYPLLVLVAVSGMRDLASRRWLLPGFAAVSLLLSRIWLPIGKFGIQSLQSFPAQRYFMSSGIWTSNGMYLAQLAAVAVLAAAFALLLRGGFAPAENARITRSQGAATKRP